MLDGAAGFLINVLFDCYLTVLLLRFLLQWTGANYYNPISRFTVKLTEPILKPLKKVIPSVAGIDIALLITLLVIAIIKYTLLIWLENGIFPYILGLILLSVAKLLALTCSLFFYAILARVILSWIAPSGYNPGVEIIHRITDPLLAPVQRFIPTISGIDLSPLVVIILIQLINLYFINYLIVLSKGLAILG